MKAYENEKNYISEVTAKMEEVLSKGIINSSEVSIFLVATVIAMILK